MQQNSKIFLPRYIHVFILKFSSNQWKTFRLQLFTEPARRFGLFIEYVMNKDQYFIQNTHFISFWSTRAQLDLFLQSRNIFSAEKVKNWT